MKTKKRLLLLFIIMGLLGAPVDSLRAQQTTGENAPARSLEASTLIYLTGAVRSPAQLKLRRDVRLTEVLACSGGVLPGGDTHYARIYRTGAGKKEITLIVADLQAIKKGRAEDLIIQPYDIIEVPRKKSRVGGCYGLDCLGKLPVRIIY